MLIWNCAFGYVWDISRIDKKNARKEVLAVFDYSGEDEENGVWLSYEAALQSGINKALKSINKKEG